MISLVQTVLLLYLCGYGGLIFWYSLGIWFYCCLPFLQQMGLFLNPIIYKCLLKVLCPVRRLITTLDSVPLKDSNRALVARSGPEINLRGCACVLQEPRHITRYPALYLSSKVVLRDPKYGHSFEIIEWLQGS